MSIGTLPPSLPSRHASLPSPFSLLPTPISPRVETSHHVVTSARDSETVVAPSPVTTPDAMMSLTAIEHLDFEHEVPCDGSWCGELCQCAAFGVVVALCRGCREGGRSFIRNDKVLEQPNVTIAACRAWTAASSAPIRALVVHELKRLQKDAPNARAWHHKDSRPWLETVLASESMGHADALAKASPNPSFNPSPEPSVKPSQEPSK